MRESVVTLVGLLPVFGFSIIRTIGCNDAPLELHRINIKAIVFPYGAKPDILRVVLPVGLGAASLFAFPCNPVADMKVLVQNRENEIGRMPIATDVNRCVGSQKRNK